MPKIIIKEKGNRNKRKIKRKEKERENWEKPKSQPNSETLRKLFGLAIKTMILACMQNHLYQFKGIKRLQKEGGPTGLDLTGELADLFMLWWDLKFVQKLKDLKIGVDLYGRFKDDIGLILDSLPKGTWFSKVYDELIYENVTFGKSFKEFEKMNLEEIYEERNKHNLEKETMSVITEIANYVHPMIQFTSDVPSNHDDNLMPILDFKVNLNSKNEAFHEFYEKETKNDRVILASSAIPWKAKENILVNEALRRLRNTTSKLGPALQNKH